MSTPEPLVSYAQNGEDIILWRCLGHVPRGFYIDVGAQHPTLHSVTRAFYERGWRGINLEPNPEFHALLRQERPEDVNLAACAADVDGTIDFYAVDGTGLSTSDEQLAAGYAQAGRQVSRLTCPAIRLDTLWSQRGLCEVHFLKIDVEGAEQAVLGGIDLRKHRPWVLVVEATRPTTAEPTHQAFEDTIVASGYRFAYFDALNRYYVADEHAELIPVLALQPNVFDGYLPAAQAELQARLDAAWADRQAFVDRLDATWAEKQQLAANLALVQAELAACQQRHGSALEEQRKAMQAQRAALEAQGAELARLASLSGAYEAAVQREQVLQRELDAHRQQAADESRHWSELLQARAEEVSALRASRSWRLTAPLRAASLLAQHSRDPEALRSLAGRAHRALREQEQLGAAWRRLRARHPAAADALARALRRLRAAEASPDPSEAPGAAEPAGMAPASVDAPAAPMSAAPDAPVRPAPPLPSSAPGAAAAPVPSWAMPADAQQRASRYVVD